MTKASRLGLTDGGGGGGGFLGSARWLLLLEKGRNAED